jgi:hypothetical protein
MFLMRFEFNFIFIYIFAKEKNNNKRKIRTHKMSGTKSMFNIYVVGKSRKERIHRYIFNFEIRRS